MKSFSVWLIKLYQKIPGSWHGECRFYPTCSNYALESIEKNGFFKGWFLAFKRIFRCNPFGGYGYDPVPNLTKKRRK